MSTSSTGKVWVYRREEIPIGTSEDNLRQSFPLDVRDQIQVTSLSLGINLDRPSLTATFSFTAQSGDELLHSEDKDFYGFTPLHTPEGDIEADIIALTGLAGHAFGSWAASPQMWLRDFLPKDLPKTRILLYGYDSSLADSQSRHILTDLSNNFVVKLDTMRSLSQSETRPLILIGHSLGCLIIKDAIIKMKSYPIHHLSQSLPTVDAVIFFGAPHRGLNITALQSIMNGTPSAELISELRWQSSTMQRLNDGFRLVCEGLEILAIYEKNPTPTLRISEFGRLERTGRLEMMVEKDSALLYLEREIAIGLEQDHSRIVKVDRGQSGCYDDIVHFLRRSISSTSIRRKPQQSFHDPTLMHSVPGPGHDPSKLPLQAPQSSGNLVTINTRSIMSQEALVPPRVVKPLFLVPFDRDESFINRIKIFNDIAKYSKQHRRLALSGIGGIGKSQIAIEYCYRFRDVHPHAHILWVHASTKQRFDQAYKEIGRTLKLPKSSDPNTDTLRLVSDWFNEVDDESWLMVLDNADDLDMFFARPTSTASDSQCTSPLSDYLPRNSRGFMLITTRDDRLARQLTGTHAAIVVRPMSPEEAQGLLETWRTDPSDSSNIDQSGHLLKALGYIPLAITQAAAFISENRITLEQYLEMFHTSDSDIQDLLDEDLGDSRRDPQSQNSIIKTWKMSFDQISKQKPRAAEMLSLMAVLDRQGIPKSLLRHQADRDVDFTTALGTLQAFSLVSAEVDGTGYEIHRLVQLATQKWLDIQGKIGVWQESALLVVADKFPSGEFENWPTCESILPHAQKVLQYGDVKENYPVQFSKLLSNVALLELGQGRYRSACASFVTAIEVQEKTFGLDHDSTLRTMTKMAETYWRLSRLNEAEKLYAQVSEAQSRRLGAEHPETLENMHGLVVIYQDQGRWEEAEKLSLQLLEMEERVLGAEHLIILESKEHLASIYDQQCRYEETEKLHSQVVEARKKLLGAEHPDTLATINNLALTHNKQGRLEEAEKLYLQIMEVEKRVLGAEHPGTLATIHNLASVYDDQGRLNEAEKLYLQVMEAEKRVLGAEHPDTLISMYNLAYCWNEQGRHSEAIALMKDVVALREKTLGADHLQTIDAAECLKEWSADEVESSTSSSESDSKSDE